MKTEININNKARFFAQHWGQLALKYSSHTIQCMVSLNVLDFSRNNLKHAFLELTPLSDITDEDAIEVAKIECPDLYHKQYPNYGRFLLDNLNASLTKQKVEIVDYLRSKGYGLPWMGLSVEEMVQAGWIKLTESLH